VRRVGRFGDLLFRHHLVGNSHGSDRHPSSSWARIALATRRFMLGK